MTNGIIMYPTTLIRCVRCGEELLITVRGPAVFHCQCETRAQLTKVSPAPRTADDGDERDE
jgi:antitoxin (DNA-binding transcriptional repressor) of toxin-antitoxin stability system